MDETEKINSELFAEFTKEKEKLTKEIEDLKENLKERDKIIKDFINTPQKQEIEENAENEETNEMFTQKDVNKVIELFKRKRGIK